MTFQDRLQENRFTVTCEIMPPKGSDAAERLEEAESLKGRVDAVAVTDGKSSVMAMNPLIMSHLLQRRGFETLLHVSCRDRNRLGLQSDLLGAAALGVGNLVVATGDYASMGDHPQTKPVFDLDSVQLLKVIQKMESGQDLGGNPLTSRPKFFVGATVSPSPGREAALELQLIRMEKKIAGGAKFFLTQPVFDVPAFSRFMKRAASFGVPVLAGVLPLKSVSMARFINKNLPGVFVPEALIEEIGKAPDRVKASLVQCARLVQELREFCQGVHFIPAGWERKVPAILETARL
jgi:methylenetetrahydrofolate reductase (NADPH)